MSAPTEPVIPGGDVLGLHRLLSGAAPAQGRNQALRSLVHWLQSDADFVDRLVALRGEGWQAMVVVGDPRLFKALNSRPLVELPTLMPIVPNLQGFMREAVEYGMVGAGLRRARRVGPVSLFGLGLRSIGRVRQILKRDFTIMLRSFIELELADYRRYPTPLFFLQPQMTDLALAMDNPRLLEAFVEAVGRRTESRPALATCNFARLVDALERWGIEVSGILTPWNAAGEHMRPHPQACREALKHCSVPVWAECRAGMTAPGPEDLRRIREDGLAGAVRDDVDLWIPGQGSVA